MKMKSSLSDEIELGVVVDRLRSVDVQERRAGIDNEFCIGEGDGVSITIDDIRDVDCVELVVGRAWVDELSDQDLDRRTDEAG